MLLLISFWLLFPQLLFFHWNFGAESGQRKLIIIGQLIHFHPFLSLFSYSLYDPSYSNRESFGFFVDVGNGWTTIVPSLMFLIGMMVELMDARVLGMIGLAKFYQELYGTCIYFLSFILNKRYVNRSMLEVGLFVGLSNGLWFVFPLIGMWASATLIMTGNYSVFR